MSTLPALDVYRDDELVGRLQLVSPARVRFEYDSAYRARRGRLPISVSLPVRDEPFEHQEAAPYFEGLLPEGERRVELARLLGLSDRNLFSLLAEIGRDCAGALQILPAGRAPDPPSADAVPLSLDDLAARIRALPTRPLGVDLRRDVRLSLAGAQPKLVLRRLADGRLAEPRHGAPSTHIVKPALQGYDGIVENEVFCLRVVARAGLPAVDAEWLQVGTMAAVLIRRYDRHTDVVDGSVTRVHQEDACQALGVLPEAKYEAEGGPGVFDVWNLLGEATTRTWRAVARLDWLDQVVANVVLGNHDAHGKNVSILYAPGGARLAPLYDVVSTAAYRELTPRLAMRIGRERRGAYVQARHWDALAEECGVNLPAFRRRRRALAERLRVEAHAERDALRASGVAAPVVDRIVAVVDARAERV